MGFIDRSLIDHEYNELNRKMPSYQVDPVRNALYAMSVQTIGWILGFCASNPKKYIDEDINKIASDIYVYPKPKEEVQKEIDVITGMLNAGGVPYEASQVLSAIMQALFWVLGKDEYRPSSVYSNWIQSAQKVEFNNLCPFLGSNQPYSDSTFCGKPISADDILDVTISGMPPAKWRKDQSGGNIDRDCEVGEAKLNLAGATVHISSDGVITIKPKNGVNVKSEDKPASSVGIPISTWKEIKQHITYINEQLVKDLSDKVDARNSLRGALQALNWVLYLDNPKNYPEWASPLTAFMPDAVKEVKE